MTAPSADQSVRPVIVRRAVIGTLARQQRTMRAAELRDAVLVSRPVRWAGQPLTSKKVTEVLRNQMRSGRVRRVGYDAWFASLDDLPRTTRWRLENWERGWDEAIAERRSTTDLVDHHSRNTVGGQRRR